MGLLEGKVTVVTGGGAGLVLESAWYLPAKAPQSSLSILIGLLRKIALRQSILN